MPDENIMRRASRSHNKENIAFIDSHSVAYIHLCVWREREGLFKHFSLSYCYSYFWEK